MEEKNRLENLISDYFKQEDRNSPTGATAMGIHDYDDELEDYSPSGVAKLKVEQKEFEDKFATVDYESLDKDGKIKYHLFNERLKSGRMMFDQVRPFERDPSLYPSVATTSIHMLMLRNFAPIEERLLSAATRMEKFPEIFAAARKNLENPPQKYTEIALDMVGGASSLIRGVIARQAENIPSIRDRVLKACDIAEKTYKDYEKYLKEEVMPRSTGDFAYGREMLDTMLTESEFLDYDSEALWKIGERELEKCEQELTEFSQKNFDPKKNWRQVFKEIKEHHPAADKIIPAYVESLEKAKNFIIKNDVVDIPKNQNLIAMETPEFNRSLTPFAAMMPPAAYEEDQTSYLWITPVDFTQSEEAQRKQMMDNSYGKIQYVALHEAYPGHHLQLVYSSMVKDPIYKRTFSGIFIEGWAFYCEQMMKELGYFDNDGTFCQLEAAYWRALRILLDIGLHTRRFDFDGAMELLQSKVDWSPFVARGELKRYTHQPTQALSYYTGKLEIFRIKEAYQKMKGSAFSLKQFHQDLLAHGSLPPKVIEWKLGTREIEKPKVLSRQA